MAAGKGTRLKSRRAKVLHEIGGKPLLAHVIKAALQVVPAEHIHVIIGHQAESVRAAVAPLGVKFVLQAEQRGTGHAIMCAREQVAGYRNILVLSGDVPLIRQETIARVRDFHLGKKAAMTILTAVPPDPFGYGRVIRAGSGSDRVKAIVEQKALTKAQQKAREINSGIYAFATAPLFANIDRLTTSNAHHEFYLTDMAALLVKRKAMVVALKASDPAEVLGANTLAELASLDAAMRMRKCHDLMTAGVSIYRPETCVIDPDVEIDADTILEPFVQILGCTRISSDCRIRSFSIIRDSQIAANVLVRPGCVIDQSIIASGAQLGPYSHLRPGSEIGEDAHVGNFVETKKTKLGRGAKANHLTYLGDSEIGPGVNVGAGTITCNYDGTSKHMTVIEEGAFIGSDSTLVAPLRVGKGAYVAAGSTITDDVPPDALALGRSRQITKEAWARRRRDELAKSKAGK
jgi:bifunctional UDP-N-acetylglucosamine pyrophosphorylase/glucosamine-1-phosphate N-acetyltransferase